MRIYCDLCDKVQPAQIDDCEDVKTGDLYQDIVCGECGLVITSGTGIKRKWVGLTDQEVFDIWLHEMPAPDKVFYQKLCRSVEAKLKEKNT